MEFDPTTPQTPEIPKPFIPLLPPPEKFPQLPSGIGTSANTIDWESLGGVIEGTTPTDLGC